MSSIDRLAAQDAARLYTQNTDVARSGAAQQASKALQHARQHQSKSVDSVSLSENARSLAAARDAVKNVPDVREQKVAEIKQHVSDGTYNVPAKMLARKMLTTVGSQS
jgi:negative regulator of flagellin synthesis FlgM